MSNKLSQHDHSEHGQHPKTRPLHRDWRCWVTAVLMLIAISMYVLSLDEAVVPGPWLAGPAENSAPVQP